MPRTGTVPGPFEGLPGTVFGGSVGGFHSEHPGVAL